MKKSIVTLVTGGVISPLKPLAREKPMLSVEWIAQMVVDWTACSCPILMRARQILGDLL